MILPGKFSQINNEIQEADSYDVRQNLKTFHFVIKSPPKASFIKAMHKLTKPFLNEVTWYMVRLSHLFLIKCK